MASLRASESPECVKKRLDQSKTSMVSLRASESPECAKNRLDQSKTSMASLRASEPSECVKKRLDQSKISMASLRTKIVSVENAMLNFHVQINEGPDYVCTVCHRMMYKLSVSAYNRANYSKCSPDIIESVQLLEYVSSDGNQWVCRTCDRVLRNGKLPAQAKANNLHLPPVPPELACLNALEVRLVCLRVPFMKMVALPVGKQRCIHGPAVNVPSKLNAICNLLPRLPSQTELIPIKFKRKLHFKGHYLYDYVCPQRVMRALTWLKSNNPLYSNVLINFEWEVDASKDDSDLFTGLTGDSSNAEANINSKKSVVVTDYDLHYNVMVDLANDNNYTIIDVPGRPGDCLFDCVARQLPSDFSEHVDGTALRAMTVEYLYRNPCVNGIHRVYFVSDDALGIPNGATVTSEEKWQLYLHGLAADMWADHVAIQAVADVLNVAISILSSITKDTVLVSPLDQGLTSQCTLNVGLIHEQHYVAFDTCSSVSSNNQTDKLCNDGTCETISDETFEEGDQHSRLITGGSQTCTFLLSDEPECQIHSIAPAEGQHPMNIIKDVHFELMCNPDKFPFGMGCFNETRTQKLTYRKYFQQRLLDVDGRFARDLDYLFAAQYIVESKQIFDDASNFIWRQKPSTQLTARDAKSSSKIEQNVRNDKAYAFLKNVRGSPPYYQKTFYELLAMIRQLGTPTWFFTLSAADMKWPDTIRMIARQHGVSYSDDDIKNLSFEERSKWLRQNPITATRHFQYRLATFFKEFLKSSAHPLGEIVDEAVRIEFQNRGSPHAHCVLWVKNAPKFGEQTDQEVCDFIDKYVSCSIPEEEGQLKELVLSLQKHRHSSYCKRNRKCRFSFPHPPSTCTLIARPPIDTELPNYSDALIKVRQHLLQNNIDISLAELFQCTNVDPSHYEQGLRNTTRGNKVVLQRDPCECNINNYNSSVLLAWQANMDVQYVMDAYACVMYVASYIMKHEKSMGELLKQVANEVRDEDLSAQLRKVGTAFLTHREVSAQETVYRILSMPMKRLSRTVIFVDTNPKHQRIAVLKRLDMLNRMEDDDTDVFQKSLVDRYQHRPSQIGSMSFAEFAAKYVTRYQRGDDEVTDTIPNSDDSDETVSSQIVLTNGYGRMSKRRREAVIRFRRYNKDAEPSNWYRAKLMLYHPWYNEDVDLLGGYDTYEQHYNSVRDAAVAVEQKYSYANVDDISYDFDGFPEHAWDQMAPSNQEGQLRSMNEGTDNLTDLSQEDLLANARILAQSSDAGRIQSRYESAANASEIQPNEYRQMMRQLNDKQKEIVMFHRNWCKEAVKALRNDQPVKPYNVFMSGS